MTKREMHRFKRVLEGLRAEAIHALENSVGRLVIYQSADPVDQMCDLAEQEIESRNISVLTSRLQCVENALRAIREGSFGRCASCGCEIPQKRLEAIPWSSVCVRCKESADAAATREEQERGAGSGYALAR